MTLKALARTAHQSLQASADCPIRHSHIHELLAAAFGYDTWAALSSDALLADNGIGDGPQAPTAPQIAGRALQLRYDQGQALAMAGALGELIAERGLGLVRWAAFASLLPTGLPSAAQGAEEDDDGWDEDLAEGEEAPRAVQSTPALPREQFLSSGLLLDSLAVAAVKQPHAHQVLAQLYRCRKPNPYLYEESLKGRQLTGSERIWVEEYLQLAPRYALYEAHLKAAAEAGVRAAALEYGTQFEQPEFVALAERLEGHVDPELMARVASSPEARSRWLRQAAQAGSRRALEQLADLGEPWAQDRMAPVADVYWLRDAAERALAENEAARAWVFQYVALERGEDLTRSTLAARHDGGSNDGEIYDDDYGGPMYVDGAEGLVLPELDQHQHREAQARAQALVHG